MTFTIGARTGVQRKGIVVKTDLPGVGPVPLSLVATIPEVLRLPASVLLWTETERADPKSLIVEANARIPVTSLHARSDSPFLKVSVERESLTEFRVEVTPTSGRRNISGTLQLEAILESGQRKSVNAFLRVR